MPKILLHSGTDDGANFVANFDSEITIPPMAKIALVNATLQTNPSKSIIVENGPVCTIKVETSTTNTYDSGAFQAIPNGEYDLITCTSAIKNIVYQSLPSFSYYTAVAAEQRPPLTNSRKGIQFDINTELVNNQERIFIKWGTSPASVIANQGTQTTQDITTAAMPNANTLFYTNDILSAGGTFTRTANVADYGTNGYMTRLNFCLPCFYYSQVITNVGAVTAGGENLGLYFVTKTPELNDDSGAPTTFKEVVTDLSPINLCGIVIYADTTGAPALHYGCVNTQKTALIPDCFGPAITPANGHNVFFTVSNRLDGASAYGLYVTARLYATNNNQNPIAGSNMANLGNLFDVNNANRNATSMNDVRFVGVIHASGAALALPETNYNNNTVVPPISVPDALGGLELQNTLYEYKIKDEIRQIEMHDLINENPPKTYNELRELADNNLQARTAADATFQITLSKELLYLLGFADINGANVHVYPQINGVGQYPLQKIVAAYSPFANTSIVERYKIILPSLNLDTYDSRTRGRESTLGIIPFDKDTLTGQTSFDARMLIYQSLGNTTERKIKSIPVLIKTSEDDNVYCIGPTMIEIIIS